MDTQKQMIENIVNKFIEQYNYDFDLAEFDYFEKVEVIEYGVELLSHKWGILDGEPSKFVNAILNNNLNETISNSNVITIHFLKLYVNLLYVYPDKPTNI